MAIKTSKQITSTGGSLGLNVTKEVKALGLGRGDTVDITIGPADPEDIKMLEMGRRLNNPNAKYINGSILTPADKLIDGSAIEDHTATMDQDVISKVSDCLELYDKSLELITRTTQNTLKFPNVSYSAPMKSFVCSFYPNIANYSKRPYFRSFYILQLIDKLLDIVDVRKSNIRYVSALSEYVEDAYQSLAKVLRADADSVPELISNLNERFDQESVKAKQKDLLYVLVQVAGDKSEGYDTAITDVRISVVSCNSPFQLNRELREHKEKLMNSDQFFYYTLIGPYETADRANKYKSFLDVMYERFEGYPTVPQVCSYLHAQMEGLPRFVDTSEPETRHIGKEYDPLNNPQEVQ